MDKGYRLYRGSPGNDKKIKIYRVYRVYKKDGTYWSPDKPKGIKLTASTDGSIVQDIKMNIVLTTQDYDQLPYMHHGVKTMSTSDYNGFGLNAPDGTPITAEALTKQAEELRNRENELAKKEHDFQVTNDLFKQYIRYSRTENQKLLKLIGSFLTGSPS